MMKKIRLTTIIFFSSIFLFANTKEASAEICKIEVVTENITKDKPISVRVHVPAGYLVGNYIRYSFTLDGSPIPSAQSLNMGWRPITLDPQPTGKHTIAGAVIPGKCDWGLKCDGCTQEIIVFEKEGAGTNCIYCTNGFHYNEPYKLCCKNKETPECRTQKSPLCAPEKMKDYSTTTTSKNTCSSINDETNKEEFDKCVRCKDGLGEFADNPGSWSALGCIPVGPEKFIQWLLNSAINIVGGLAFLMILFGSFKVATSSGNPEALNEGKEIIFAALAGLLFIVFSVILLKIIGHDILQIPGFQ